MAESYFGYTHCNHFINHMKVSPEFGCVVFVLEGHVAAKSGVYYSVGRRSQAGEEAVKVAAGAATVGFEVGAATRPGE